jgi:tyrosinase
MKFSSLFYSLSLASSVFAHAAPQPFAQDVDDIHDEPAHLQERQSGGFMAVTGVPGNAIYPRLEVRQMLFTKPNQWTLFVLALQKFQQMSQSDRMSWYQIAGIHGVPRQNWDGVGQCSTCKGTDGYCTHDSVLFPGWHRAYLALFEQQFMVIVNELANSYPDNRRAWMTGAASTMRFPFWDWAAHPAPGYPALPNVMSDKYMTVESPTGMVTIINPLFRHDFQNPKDLVYTPFINWQVTLRYPNSNANTASSTTTSATNAFNNVRASLQDQVYQMFSTCKSFAGFASDNSGAASTRCSISLEGIHNTIHTTLGGPGSASVSAGHMTYLSTAAFDPGFWLHHMNVDRLFALWQGINPNSYGASQAAPHATWTIPAGSVQDANSPLTPFHRNTNGDFWTSNQVRDWKVFKYTYPEFSNSDGSSKAIMSAVNKLYGPGATATAGSSKRTAEPQTYDESAFNEDTDVVDGTVKVHAVAPTAAPAFSASFSLDFGSGSDEESTSFSDATSTASSSDATTTSDSGFAFSTSTSFSFGFGSEDESSVVNDAAAAAPTSSDASTTSTTPTSSDASTTSASSDAISTTIANKTAKASAVSSAIVDAGNGTSSARPTNSATLKDNSTPLRANNGSSYQYVCNIETPRYALNGSYSVFVFNGEPENPDPLLWTFDKNLIGPAGILAQPGMTNKNITVTMGIPLTRTLVYEYTKGNIPDLTEESVDHYLQQKLQWRVVGPQGQEIDSTTIPGFKAQVYGSTAAKQKSEDEIPQWSEFVPLVKATEGNEPSPESISFVRA